MENGEKGFWIAARSRCGCESLKVPGGGGEKGRLKRNGKLTSRVGTKRTFEESVLPRKKKGEYSFTMAIAKRRKTRR